VSTSFGKLGEERAASYLESKGHVVRTRNYRHKRNEIDIISEKDNVLVFVEVKARSYTAFGNPEDSVDAKKAARIIEAAENYIYEVDWQGNVRFDVIAVERANQHFSIKHFEDAFY